MGSGADPVLPLAAGRGDAETTGARTFGTFLAFENVPSSCLTPSLLGLSSVKHTASSRPGSDIWDRDGNRLLDFTSQLVFSNLGHQHPRVVEAIKEQAQTLCSIAPRYANPARSQAARLIAERTPGDLNRVFFTNGERTPTSTRFAWRGGTPCSQPIAPTTGAPTSRST